MDTEAIEKLLTIANCLKDGKDPMTGLVFEQDTVLNSPAIKEYNKNVATILESLLPKEKKKTIFIAPDNEQYISQDSIDNFEYWDEAVSVSCLCKDIDLLKKPKFPLLRAAKVAEWLCLNGFLTEIKRTETQAYREVTEKGMKLGIVGENREAKDGTNYYVNLYSPDAQKYIVFHINEIFKWAFESDE